MDTHTRRRTTSPTRRDSGVRWVALAGLSDMSAVSPSTDTPRWVESILDSRATLLVARLALTLPYWWSGIDKATHPQAALAEIAKLLG